MVTLINYILKIEQLLVQYLYHTKEVKLQGIGVFKVKKDVVITTEGDKFGNAFLFEYNLKTTEDELLVDYIVQETRKIKPLASSDLDSYAILAKQLLNLGKPFYIEGIGTIQKNQLGFYEFISGQFVSPKIGDGIKSIKDTKQQDVTFETDGIVNNRGRNLMIGLTTVGIIFVSLTLYYFIILKNNNTEEIEQTVAVNNLKENLKPTTILNAPTKTTDTISKISLAHIDTNTINSNSFKIVLKEYSTSKAVEMAYSKLTEYGHKVKIIKTDSSKFKLIMTFNRQLKDTLRVKDSLKIFFGGKPYVDKVNNI